MKKMLSKIYNLLTYCVCFFASVGLFGNLVERNIDIYQLNNLTFIFLLICSIILGISTVLILHRLFCILHQKKKG